MASGYIAREKGLINEEKSRLIVLTGVLFFESPIVLIVLWKFSIKPSLVILPVLGLLLAILSGVAGYLISKNSLKNQLSLGAFTLSSSLSNQGYTMGGFICYLLHGEYGYGLSVIYITYFHLFVYLIGYPIANYWSNSKKISIPKQILNNLKDIRFLPVYMMITGLVLNVMNVEHPIWSEQFIRFMIPPASFIVLFAIGLQMKFSIKIFKNSIVYKLFFVKFVVTPFSALALIKFLSLESIIKNVIFIEAITPSAIYSIVICTLFELDRQLATTLFISSNLFFLVFIFPVLNFFSLSFI